MSAGLGLSLDPAHALKLRDKYIGLRLRGDEDESDVDDGED